VTKILVLNDNNEIIEQFQDPPMRPGQWDAFLLGLQRAVKSAGNETEDPRAQLVPMVDFIGPAFTLLIRAEATSQLAEQLGNIIMGMIHHFNSVLDTDVKDWKRGELYGSIEDWKKDVVVNTSQALQKFAQEGDSDSTTNSPTE
jgi:hypothetical protein